MTSFSSFWLLWEPRLNSAIYLFHTYPWAAEIAIRKMQHHGLASLWMMTTDPSGPSGAAWPSCCISLMISLTPTTFYAFSSLLKPPVPFAPSLSSAENVASYLSRKIWATERERLHSPVTKSACSQPSSSPALPSHPAASVSLWARDTTPHLLEHFPPDFSISCTTIVFPVCVQTCCDSPLLNVWINKNRFLTLLPMIAPFFCFPFWRIASKQFPAERRPLCLPRSCSPGKRLLQGGRPLPSCGSTGPRSFLRPRMRCLPSCSAQLLPALARDCLHFPAGVLGLPGFSSFCCPLLCSICFLFMTCKSQNVLDLGSWTFSLFLYTQPTGWLHPSPWLYVLCVCWCLADVHLQCCLTRTTVCFSSHSAVAEHLQLNMSTENGWSFPPFKSAPPPFLSSVNSITISQLAAPALTVTFGSSFSLPHPTCQQIPAGSPFKVCLESRHLSPAVLQPPGLSRPPASHVDYHCSVLILHALSLPGL